MTTLSGLKRADPTRKRLFSRMNALVLDQGRLEPRFERAKPTVLDVGLFFRAPQPDFLCLAAIDYSGIQNSKVTSGSLLQRSGARLLGQGNVVKSGLSWKLAHAGNGNCLKMHARTSA